MAILEFSILAGTRANGGYIIIVCVMHVIIEVELYYVSWLSITFPTYTSVEESTAKSFVDKWSICTSDEYTSITIVQSCTGNYHKFVLLQVHTSLVPRLSWNANVYRAESLVSFVRKHDVSKTGPNWKATFCAFFNQLCFNARCVNAR